MPAAPTIDELTKQFSALALPIRVITTQIADTIKGVSAALGQGSIRPRQPFIPVQPAAVAPTPGTTAAIAPATTYAASAVPPPIVCYSYRQQNDHRFVAYPSMSMLKQQGKCHKNQANRWAIRSKGKGRPEVRRAYKDQPIYQAIKNISLQFQHLLPQMQPVASSARVSAIRLGSAVSDSGSSDSDSEVEGEIISINTAKRYEPYSRKGKEDLERKATEEKKLPGAKNVRAGFYTERNARDNAGAKVRFEEDVEISDIPEAKKSRSRQPKPAKEQGISDNKRGGDKPSDTGAKAYRLLDKIADEADLERIFSKMIDQASSLTVREVLASSAELRKMYYKKQTPRAAINIVVRSARLRPSPEHAADEDLYAYGCPTAWVSVDGMRIKAMFDGGSEINLISKAKALEARLPLRRGTAINILGVTGAVSKFKGVCMAVEVNLGGARRTVPIFVVDGADYDLILGRVYKRKARFTETNNDDGTCDIQVTGEDRERVIMQGYRADSRSNRFVEEIFDRSLNE